MRSHSKPSLRGKDGASQPKATVSRFVLTETGCAYVSQRKRSTGPPLRVTFTGTNQPGDWLKHLSPAQTRLQDMVAGARIKAESCRPDSASIAILASALEDVECGIANMKDDMREEYNLLMDQVSALPSACQPPRGD